MGLVKVLRTVTGRMPDVSQIEAGRSRDRSWIGAFRRTYGSWLSPVHVIGRRYAWNFSALITAQIVVALVGVASTRFLTPSDKGLFTSVYLWSLIGQAVVGLSLPNALLYYGASEGRSRPSARLAVLLGLGSLVCGAVLGVFVGEHAPGHTAIQVLLLPLPTAMLAFEATSYSALAEGRRFYAYRLAQALSFAALAVPLLLITHSATLLTATLLFSYVTSVAVYFWSSVRAATRPVPLGVAQMLRWSLRGHAGLTLSLLATRLDVLFVTVFLSTLAAGQYVAASALPNFVAFSGTALGLSLARRTTAQHTGTIPVFAARWGLMLVAATAATGILLAEGRAALLITLFGHPYAPAAPLVIPLAIALPFWSLAAYEAQLLAAVGRPVDQTIGQGIAAIFLAGGSAYGVTHQSTLIVAWSNVVAYVCSVVWQSVALATSRRR